MSDEWVVTMPKLGETVTEGTVGGWRKQVGDSIEFDDPLFEVSTDKVDSEIPSPYDGVILEIMVPEGETVPVGTPLVRIGAPGSTPNGGNDGPPAVVAGAGGGGGPAEGGPGGAGAGGAGVPAEAVPGTAGSGGPSLNDPAAPQMGGSEAMPALEDPGVGVPSGEVHEITMPKLGETVTEGTVGGWRKQVGDTVEFDDPLFEVSTDKVDSEIPSPYDGVILEIMVPEGETVPVGTPLVRIGAPGSTPNGGNDGPPAVVAGSSGAGVPAEAVPGTAGSGGPSLNDPAAPQMGGSEAMPALEDPGVGVPSGVVHEITMPKLGETVTEGTVGSWKKQVGDSIEFDDPLFEVSTDKVDSEIPSPYDSVLLEILVPEGETVAVGTPLARIGEQGASDGGAAVSGSGPAAVGAPTAPAGGPASGGAPTGGAVPAAGGRDGRLLSPLVRRLVAESGLDVAAIAGTGAHGRIRREDVQQAIANGGAQAATPTQAPAPVQAAAPTRAPAATAPATTAPATTQARPA